MSMEFTDDQSSLVQVMAWCHQATSITWANVDPDLYHHMVSPDQNELIGVIALVLQGIHLHRGGTARWLQLQPSSAWPRLMVSAFQYSRCMVCPNKARCVSFSAPDIDFVKWRSLVITVDVTVDPSFLVMRCRKYSPSRWLQELVTMVATDVPGGMTRVARQFWRTCPADNSRNMF